MIPIKLKKEALNYHEKYVLPSVEERISKVLKDDKIYRGTGDKRREITLSKLLRSYLESLQVEEHLNELLYCEPQKFDNLIKEIEGKLPKSVNRTGKKSKAYDYIILYSIFFDFGYDINDFKKGEFISLMDLDVCPYCNRNYIFALDEKGKIKPEIDHFYPKTIYPFLAASFYNLIPSCQTCNGFGGKSSEDTYLQDAVNPYLIQNDDFQFGYVIKSLDFMSSLEQKGSLKINFIKQINQNNSLFKLSKLYEKHEDHVLELITKSKLQYSEKYREYLKSYEGLSYTNSEIDRLIIGNYTELDELHKRPLSKLYRDIALELGLIIPKN